MTTCILFCLENYKSSASSGCDYYKFYFRVVGGKIIKYATKVANLSNATSSSNHLKNITPEYYSKLMQNDFLLHFDHFAIMQKEYCR